jgi:hypothetical protein
VGFARMDYAIWFEGDDGWSFFGILFFLLKFLKKC